MASTKLQRTFSAEGDNIYKWTYSFWVKRSKISSGDHAMAAAYYSATYEGRIYFRGTDQLEVYDYWNGSYTLQKKTNRLFRDTSAWYHIVVSNDNTQASADDRTKIYVNGVQETSFAINTQFPQNQRNSFNNDYTKYFGSYGSGDYLDGSMSHIHFIDGTAYAPTEFGETDSTTGEWKIKTNVSVTYGTNGFFILKDGNSVTDQSGNSNNFTVGAGTLTKTEDNPSNVFCTLNPLYNSGGTVTYSAGNNRFAEADGQWKTTFSTLGASSGKYYAEFKCNGNYMFAGVADYNVTKSGIADRNFASTTYISEQGYGLYNSDGSLRYRGSETSYASSYGSGDIVQVAFDVDNNKLYFGINGTWQNSANPSTNSGGFTMNATNPTYVFAVAVLSDEVHCNFGNGYFNTTAVSSAGTNASGNGIFEYDVPTGYTALSTKGLNL